jgi:hypothetical protein
LIADELDKKMKKQPSIAIMEILCHDGHVNKINVPPQMQVFALFDREYLNMLQKYVPGQ